MELSFGILCPKKMNTHYNPKNMWAPNGRAFSQGVAQGEGKVLHITGQVAWDENSEVVGEGDIKNSWKKV